LNIENANRRLSLTQEFLILYSFLFHFIVLTRNAPLNSFRGRFQRGQRQKMLLIPPLTHIFLRVFFVYVSPPKTAKPCVHHEISKCQHIKSILKIPNTKFHKNFSTCLFRNTLAVDCNDLQPSSVQRCISPIIFRVHFQIAYVTFVTLGAFYSTHKSAFLTAEFSARTAPLNSFRGRLQRRKRRKMLLVQPQVPVCFD